MIPAHTHILWASLCFGLLLSSPVAAAHQSSAALKGFNRCAEQLLGDCDFYSRCLEAHYPCGKQSYALAFGQRYCDRFDRDYGNRLYLEGFVGKTRTSLQQDLVSYVNHHRGIGSCRQLEEFAFQSHSHAYVAQPFGICHLLDFGSLKTIVTTIDGRDILRPKLWRSSLEVVQHCVATALSPFLGSRIGALRKHNSRFAARRPLRAPSTAKQGEPIDN